MLFNSSVLNFLHNRELDEIFACVSIRGFAISMIGIFVPIYLLTAGFPIKDVFIFYIIVNLTYALTAIPAVYLDAKLGFKHVVMISAPLLILFFALLNNIETSHFPLWLLAIIFGAHSGLFWTSYHNDFATVSDKKQLGKEVSFAKFAIKISGIFGPLVGGMVITTMGFTTLLLIVTILLTLSIVPLFFSQDTHSKKTITLKKAFTGKSPKAWIALAASGFDNSVASVIWPIFIFFSVVSSFETIGLVTSLSLIVSLIFIIITGKLADTHRDKVIRFGSITNAAVWISKAFATSVPIVYTANALHGASNTLMTVPFEAKTYDNASSSGVLEYILFRAIAIGMGSALLFAIMLYVVDITASLWMSAANSLLLMLL